MRRTFAFAAFLFVNSFLYAQQKDFKNLTLPEYYSDFDTLQNWITLASPIHLVNDRLKDQDFAAEMRSLRKAVAQVHSVMDFYKIVFNALNLLQDPHAALSTNKNLVSPTLLYPQKDTSFINSSCHFYDSIRTIAVRTGDIKSHLPVKYIDGRYVVYYPFTIKGIYIDTGYTVTRVNGKNIHQVVKQLIPEIPLLKYDLENRRSYYEEFYRIRKLYNTSDSNINLLLTKGDKKLRLNFKKSDTAIFDKKITFIGFNSSAAAKKVVYIDSLEILYIRMPVMFDAAFYINEIQKYRDRHIKKVIFDIRGNGGGQDFAWASVLKNVARNNELMRPINFGVRNNDFVKALIKVMVPDGGDEIKKITSTSAIPNKTFYTIQSPPGIFYNADSASINFAGNIYLLCSGYEYSSTGNFITMAKPNEKIISVGMPTGLVGGLDLSPIPFILPNSKIIFNLATNLDFNGVYAAGDFYHNQIEVPVKYSLEDLYHIASTDANTADLDFLINKDPMFKKVKELQ